MSAVVVTSIHAQRRASGISKTVKQLPKSSGLVTNGIQGVGCDTIIPFPASDNLVYYHYMGDNDYLSGTNEFNDSEKANYFDLSADTYNYVTGTYVWFGVANSSNVADLSKNLIFKVYADNAGTPGAQLGSSVSIPLSSIKTDVENGFLSTVQFPSPIALPSSKKFYISVDISNFSMANGDSIAIFSTEDSAVIPGIAWEKQSNNLWYNFNDTNSSWGQNVGLAIFPFVSTTASACGTLPVKLISFNAERKNKDAVVNWQVAEELNMKGYQLEKADNNNTYKPVTFIQAHNDAKNNSYSYTDVNAFANAATIQYRLKQIDNDGKVEYSKIISLKAASALNNVTFANPFNGTMHMQLNLSNPSQVKINVYNMKGSLVGTEKPASYAASSNSIDLKSTSVLKSGMYFIKLMVGSEEFTYKVMKQ